MSPVPVLLHQSECCSRYALILRSDFIFCPLFGLVQIRLLSARYSQSKHVLKLKIVVYVSSMQHSIQACDPYEKPFCHPLVDAGYRKDSLIGKQKRMGVGNVLMS